MRLARLESLATCGLGLDFESHLVQKGLALPPIVVGAASWLEPGPKVVGTLLERENALETFTAALSNPETVLVGANFPFDLLIYANEMAKRGVDAMPLIFSAFEQGRVFDVQHVEALHAIALGMLGKDPRTGGPLRDPEGGSGKVSYRLSVVVDLVLGRVNAKANDTWRLRYAELENVPLQLWPQEARDYPTDDTSNTLEVALAQAGILPKVGYRHNFLNVDGQAVCSDCGSNRVTTQCILRKKHFNIHAAADQTYAAFGLSAGAAWGFKVDQTAVDIIEWHALRNKERGQQPFIDAGIFRSDGSEDRSVLKRMVARAHGATDPCPQCAGTGKIPSPAAKPIRCSACRGRCQSWKAGGKIKEPTVASCVTCANTGLVPNPKPPLINCVSPTGEKTCDGTGYLLTDDVPRSEKDGIAYGRDALIETGDEFLASLGFYKEDEKVLKDYVPYLRTARVEDPLAGTWRDVPMNLFPNPILETLRVSYRDYIQLFPRKPGFVDLETGIYVPSLRECIVARDGRSFSSEDFKVGELYAHAQSLKWLLGYSDLATALLNDIDPHSLLAANVLGVSYDEFIRRKKETRFKNARQSMKPFSFGRPAGMSAWKIVFTQRLQGPDTPCDAGPAMIDDGNGNKIPGYKGLRFCILMAGKTSCGTRKTSVLRRKGYEQKIKPICVDCLECAEHLAQVWLKSYRENQPYFDLISDIMDNGMEISEAALERWPHLQEVYSPGQHTEPGQIMQHVSGVLRGGLDFCSGCNGFFQSLIATVTKSALCRVVRECYDNTVWIPGQQYANTKPSKFKNGRSPLYGSRFIGFFHDELFLEHDSQVAPEAADRVAEVMREEMQHACPDVAATCDAEPTLEDRWNKGAECVRDANGRLQVWKPKHEIKPLPPGMLEAVRRNLLQASTVNNV